jgi:hypothetical protein
MAKHVNGEREVEPPFHSLAVLLSTMPEPASND